MNSSRTGYLLPPLPVSCAVSAPLPATQLRGLGLSNCHFLLGRKDALLKPSPYLGVPGRQHWHETQAGQNHMTVSSEQNHLVSNPGAINPASTTTNTTRPDLLQKVTTTGAAHPTNTSCVEHPFPSALDPFSPYPYPPASSLEYQQPSYMTTSSTVADVKYLWCNLEPQNGYLTPKPSSSYSTSLKLESPTTLSTIFTGSAPESPAFAATLQSRVSAGNCMGLNYGTDVLRSQNRVKSQRSSSWPRDCSDDEYPQGLDALTSTRRHERHHGISGHSHLSRSKDSGVARTRDHRRPKLRARVPCSYGNGCRQTFNRKTDLERHVNTVHLRMRDKICPFCGYGFGRGDILTRHLKGNGCPSKPRWESGEYSFEEHAWMGPEGSVSH